jgi:type I protein arginine methyltransferase
MSSRPGKSLESDPVSDSESDLREDDEGWNDAEDDENDEVIEVISLLDDRVYPDVLSMLTDIKERHNFDFLALRQRLQLDFHECVKLVNYSMLFSSYLPSSLCT